MEIPILPAIGLFLLLAFLVLLIVRRVRGGNNDGRSTGKDGFDGGNTPGTWLGD